MKLSIIIPVYNEKKYILEVLKRVEELTLDNLKKEIVIVDDGSTDGTKELLKPLAHKYKIIFHEQNQGKGAALKTGFKNSQGDIIAIQDADLEYHPSDLAKLVQPIVTGQTLVVFGSRMLGNNPIGHWRYYFGNRAISWLTNFLYKAKLTDVETCYKVFHRQVLDNIKIEHNCFGEEVEFTTKLLKNKISILELPISYSPRKFDEGKKISWRDGVKALWLLIKYRFKK